MNVHGVRTMLVKVLEDVEGHDGFWHGQHQGVTVYIVVDQKYDRLRIMSPIGELKKADAGFYRILLQANFDRALDAKYALRQKEVWAVSMHPLGTLSTADFMKFIGQVTQLVRNTGTTYASSELIFGAEDEHLAERYVIESDEDDSDDLDDEDQDDEQIDIDEETRREIEHLIDPDV